MKIQRQTASNADLADGRASIWEAVSEEEIRLAPAPLVLTQAVSPYLAMSEGHGRIERIRVRLAHNGATLSIRLTWRDSSRDDELLDLDQFTDAVAVMLQVEPGASAMMMGAPGQPVNAWYWKADEDEPFDVFAEGYATSVRRRGSDSGLTATGYHENDHWTVVLQRPLQSQVVPGAAIEPGGRTAIAFAVWEGSNRERSGQKSVSGEFVPLDVEA